MTMNSSRQILAKAATYSVFKKAALPFAALLAATPLASFAVTLQGVIQGATNYIGSFLGGAICVLVITVAGYECWFRDQLPKKRFWQIAVGCGLVFGASVIYSKVTG